MGSNYPMSDNYQQINRQEMDIKIPKESPYSKPQSNIESNIAENQYPMERSQPQYIYENRSS